MTDALGGFAADEIEKIAGALIAQLLPQLTPLFQQVVTEVSAKVLAEVEALILQKFNV